jgi:hypothetical protein
MKLFLSELSPTLRGPNDAAYHGVVPRRARFACPDVALAIIQLNDETDGKLVFTDILRTAEASLAAVVSKRGAQPPAYSGHNFGFSFDLDLDATIKAMQMPYIALVAYLAARDWHCHRRDGAGPDASEAWHFNYGVDVALADPLDHVSWSRPLEALIELRYGPQLSLTPKAGQAALAALGIYRGEIDGIIGPISRAAIGAFQRAWRLRETLMLDVRTQRTLAFVACERVIVPPQGWPPVV